MERPKITVVGAGNVGSSTALRCVQEELGEIVLWNRTAKKAEGLVLDMIESSPSHDVDAKIVGTGDWEETADSDVVVVTAGAARKPGMSRADLLDTNAEIVRKVSERIKEHSPDAIVIMVTNPLDVTAYVARETTGFPRERVIGMAGALDTSRFKSFIARRLDVSVEDIQALVLGGHGDSMVPVSRHASVGGIPLPELLSEEDIEDLVEHTRNAGAEIVELEESGSAFYAPADAITTMIESIIKDKKRVIPCSVHLDGEYGLEDIFIGVPVVLGAGGVERVLEAPLNDEELASLHRSAEDVRETMTGL